MGMKGTMAAAMPIMGAMSSEEGGDKYKEEPAQYYVTSYNPGQQVQPGVGYIAGQGYSDGYWTEDPKKAVSGSWYGAAGGIPGTLPMPAGPVKPFTSDRDDNLGNYYSNLIGSSVGIGGATVPTPPPTAMTNYLQKVTDTIHAPEQVYQAPTYGQGDGAVMPDSVSSGAQSLAQAMREARQTQNLGQVGRSSSGFVGNALGTFYSPVDKLFNPQGGQPLYKVKKDGTIWFNGADSGKKFYGGTIDPMTGTVSVNNDPNGEWSSMLTNYLRTGEGELPKQAKRFLKAYEHLKGTGWDWRTDSSGQAPSAPVPTPAPSGIATTAPSPTWSSLAEMIRSRQTAPVGNPADILPNSQGMAGGGITALNSGRLIRGPGDGTSDSIPAQIYGEKPQRAALADGEFVFPARIVSEIGNGSTEAGARKLYSIMDRIQQDRMRTARKGGIAANTNAMRHFNV